MTTNQLALSYLREVSVARVLNQGWAESRIMPKAQQLEALAAIVQARTKVLDFFSPLVIITRGERLWLRWNVWAELVGYESDGLPMWRFYRRDPPGGVR